MASNQTLGELVYEIVAKKNAEFDAEIKKTQDQIIKLKSELDKAQDSVNKSKSAFSSLGSIFKNFKGLIEGVVVAYAGLKIKEFFTDSITGALEAQVSQDKLRHAVSNSANAVQGESEKLIEYSATLQKSTVFTDENIQAQFQLFKQRGLSLSQIEELTPVFLDYASSLDNGKGSAESLAKAQEVVTNVLTRGSLAFRTTGILLNQTQANILDYGTQAEKLSVVQDLLNSKFKGQADILANTLTGRITRIQNQYNELQESVGNALLPALGLLTEQFADASGSIDVSSGKLQTLSKVAYSATNIILGVSRTVINMAQGFTTGVEVLIGKTLAFIDFAKSGFTDKISFDAQIDSFNKLQSELKNTQEARQKVAEANFKEATELKNFQSVTRQEIQNHVDLQGTLGQTTKGRIADAKAVSDAKKELEDYQKKLVDTLGSSKKVSEELKGNLSESFKKFGTSISETLDETKQKLAEIFVESEQKKKELLDKQAKGDTLTDDEKKQIESADKVAQARIGYEQRANDQIAEIRKKLTDAGLDPNALNLDRLKSQKTLEEQIAQEKKNATLDEFTLFEQKQNEKIEKLTSDFITEVTITKNKIDQQKKLEEDLTNFIKSKNIEKKKDIEAFAQAAVIQYGQIASSLREVISLQNQLNSVKSSVPQFAEGGYVDARGGVVHPGEFVIPANLVNQFPDLVSSIDKMRTGNQTNNITINGAKSGGDMNAILNEMLWRMTRL